jgi:microcystin-dependent protein
MEPYVGEIKMFAGNFAPQGWAFCDGSILRIAENDMLFALLGTTYGGDGQTTFALPDLRGRVPIHMGRNTTTPTTYTIGQAGGVETVTLTSQQLPAHTHTVQAVVAEGDANSPAGALWASSNLKQFSEAAAPSAAMAADLVTVAGGSQPHDNMMPFQCVNFIIALYGVFPQQA